MRLILSAVALLSLLSISSCCDCRKASTNPHTLTGYVWNLYELDGSKSFVSNESDFYNLTFDTESSQMVGRASCNSYFMPYSESGARKLAISEGGLTRAMCADSENEQKFIRTLSSVDSYTIDGNMLMLQSGSDVVLIFEAGQKVK